MVEPLVGRDDELAALRGARLRGVPGVLLAATPGLGRTSVFAATVTELRERRCDVVLLRPTASARTLRFSGLSALLPNDISGPLNFDLVRAALDHRIVSSTAPFVLAVDDLHLLDEPSMQVIADEIGRDDMFLLATIDEQRIGHDPLTEHLDESPLEVLHLGPLDLDSTTTIVRRRLGDDADGAPWWERSGGNPTTLLIALDELTGSSSELTIAAGVPTAELDALGQRRPGAEVPVPADLSAASRKLLAVIAVAEPLPHDAAVDIAGQEAFDQLVDTGVLMLTDDDALPAVRLRHPALGTQVRRSLGALEARGARRAGLLALRGSWSDLPGTGRLSLAALAIDAGVALSDDELLEVARLAPLAGDARLALRIVREAANRLDRFEDHRRLADVAHEQGEVLDVETAIDDMRAKAGTQSEHAALAIAESQHLLWRGADVERALAALQRTAIAHDPEVGAVRARMLSTVGRTAIGIEAALPLVDHASPRVRTQAALAVAHGRRLQGRASDAVRVLDDAILAAGSDPDPVLSVSRQVLSVAQGLALIETGRWADALARAQQVVAYAQRYDEAPGRAIALLVHGVASLESGSPADSLPTLSSALSLFESLRQPAGVRWAISARALAHGLCGSAVDARNDLDRLQRLAPHPANLLPSLEPRARAWSLVAAAEPEAARQSLTDAIERLLAGGNVGAAWQCAHDLLSLDRPAPLLELAPIVDEPMAALRVRHARAAHLHDAAELSDLVDHFEAAGGWRWAAEAATALLHALARDGQRAAERRAGERLAGLTARCRGLDLPSLSSGGSSLLSVREREIALLAARGLTSRAIGDRLGLSMRTVDNHLARCFDKLGTRNRSELADLLGT